MVRIIKCCMVFSLMFLSAHLASAQETKTVSAEGVAAVQQNAVDIARDAAIEDAQKRAVEQAIGIMIDSQTQVENYQLISDRILSQIKGYINRYHVTGETRDGALLRVRITADVSLGNLGDDLSAIGVLMGQMHKPRTMIMIAEQNLGQEVNAWWTEPHGEQADMGVVENSFMDRFTEKGFSFIDHQAHLRDVDAALFYSFSQFLLQTGTLIPPCRNHAWLSGDEQRQLERVLDVQMCTEMVREGNRIP